MEMKKNCDITWHHASVTRKRRESQNEHRSFILWFTGLSGAGKSTLAHALEERLHQMGCRTYVFDGDNVRHGLNKDLGFSKEDRRENIRRIGEMCKLFTEAGVIALTAFISPYREDRERVRGLVSDCDFFEIYCECSLEECERRDVKGMYARARRGEIKEFTGISAPYERPDYPEITINTEKHSVDECIEMIITSLREKRMFSCDPDESEIRHSSTS